MSITTTMITGPHRVQLSSMRLKINLSSATARGFPVRYILTCYAMQLGVFRNPGYR